MARSYSPKGYDEKKPLLEKLLFSAPEYFFYETKPGRWIVLQLERVLGHLNEIIISRFPSKSWTGSFNDRLVDVVIINISRILGWINFLFERKEKENEHTLQKG
jgi:hypothetical protein